ncbi:hypothetical protein SOPP22_00165 [Shewanella sp. OPT22]|nr:hypothetical protein SOPP22_00165 [Shewanella sp. OPT22]
MIANRARYLLSQPSTVIDHHFQCMRDPFQPHSNPNGYLNFGTAENYLMDSEIQQKLTEWRQSEQANTISKHYTSVQGIEELREAFKTYLARFNNVIVDDINQLTLSTGAGTILHMLSHILLDPQDSMLTMVPAYSGFFKDIGPTFDVNLDVSNCLTAQGIDFETFERDIKQSRNLKALLINHPHNPTGYLLTESEISQVIQLAKKYDLAIISDEVYANSVYAEGQYISFLDKRFDHLDHREHIHMVYGIAKDLCLSGFKLGCFHSKNPTVNQAMGAFAFFHSVSSITQTCTAYLLKDLNWCQKFIQTNTKRLLQTQQRITHEMQKQSIEFFPAKAGIFLWADFSKRFNLATLEQEQTFNLRLFQETKINLSCGHNYYSSQIGNQRICFAKGTATVDEMLQRFNEFSAKN